MKITFARVAVFSLVLVGAALAQSPDSNEFIWVSDVHFNPLANPNLANMLIKADVGEWANILNSHPRRRSRFGEDTDWALLSSSFDAIRKTAPNAQFTVVTGDVFVHDLRDKFDASVTNHDDAAFEDFTRKTFDFVAMQLQALVPGKPVFYTLGNNDVDTCDYDLQPLGSFLRNTSAGVKSMLGRLADVESTADWTQMGAYDVQHPVLQRARIISLSSAYFSQKYQASCGSQPASDPAEHELTWLRGRLADAKAKGEKVWLIFHIAPGIDGYATAHPKDKGPGKPVVPMWKSPYTADFETLLNEYRDTIAVSLAGHEHVDDFRLIDHSLILLAPAISPLVGQSPAFRTVTYNDKDELIDATTYYLSNLDGFDDAEAPAWKKEYSFREQWGMKRLDFESFNALFHSLETDPNKQKEWMTLYNVKHPATLTTIPKTFPWLACAAGNVGEGPYESCVRQFTSINTESK